MRQARISYKKLQYAILIIILSFFAGMTVFSNPVLAHKGHAGNKVVFLKKEEALKQMLPAGTKVVQRKEMLDAGKAEKVKNELGVKLSNEIYTYYLATDRTTGKISGAAIVSEIEYMHGEMNLAIGIDTKGHVTKAALLSVNEKYVPDMKAAAGTGYMRQFDGVAVQKLVSMANEASRSSVAMETILSNLRDMAAVLSAFLASTP
ncbi:MAG: hypothetical protein IT393_12210 [Nitrospirae bacterium]|nr:hypothetical protein [Nitrospirota bacterium]